MINKWHFLDSYTERHSRNVSRYALALGQALMLTDEEMEVLNCAALLHDVGKAMISLEILQKPGRLTEEEFEVIKQHPLVGAEVAEKSKLDQRIIDGIRAHHERWDGGGYPFGLKGEEIPFFAQIIAVADAFDAMTSQRVYRPAMSFEVAMKELEQNAGLQFSPHLVSVFVETINGLPRPTPTPSSPANELLRRMYATPLDLLNAVLSREPSFYQCVECGLSFTSLYLMDRHAERVGHRVFTQVVNIFGTLFKKPSNYVVGEKKVAG